ncbi:MAG: cyclic nucleotide-binding domain-containing protein [Bdellovibrionaceae bacterium]|nr:cyclic nucleotide-binding domain-containing protein [Pseudobdellovibrionaceae bacterium]MDW8190897.1 cyclic nucleotide-binding domain-containing protein [Pseudobdellovibrionaceae bacterium]
MGSAVKKLVSGEFLFKEGDAPDAMYVVKSGRFEVIKTKGSGEIKLAELGPGAMVGEMSFFDNKPRSASVRASKDGEVIVLPYKALHTQFSQFPEWTKAIMRTVNEHLRKANQRIKELEQATGEDDIIFPPHTITKLMSIFAFVTEKFGKPSEHGHEINSSIIRKYTIQVFQEPTHKMNKMIEVLAAQNLLKTESTGDGNQKVTVFNVSFFFEFVEWYNRYLFQKEEERATIEEKELRILNGLIHFAKKQNTQTSDGTTKLSLTDVQNDSMRELGDVIRIDDVNTLIEKKVIGDKFMENNQVFVTLDVQALEKIAPFWTLIYALKKITRKNLS